MNPSTMAHGAVAKVYVLKSSDNDLFEVEEAVAVQSLTIKHLIEDDCAQSPIPLLNISSKILVKVLEYCKRHAEAPGHGNGAVDDGRLKEFDAEFVNVDQAMLFDIIMAANYLEIKGLFDLLCQAIANMIKGKTVEQVRTTFNIKNDLTPEEEEEIRRQNHWAFH